MARKRMNNEGSLYFRHDRQRWCAQVSLDGRRLTRYARTQREARLWLKQTLARIEGGMTFNGTQLTLGRYISTWLDGKTLSQRPGTVEQYRQVCRQYILPDLGAVRLNSILPAHLSRLYLLKRDQGCGERTVQLIHTVLHCLLNQAVRDGILGRNPADSVQRPRVQPREFHVLTEAQAQRLVIASQGTRHGMLFYLALVTGMRQGELLGLKWSDLDWSRGTLNVQRQLRRIPGQGYQLVPPKTKAGRRQVKLGQSALDRLAGHRLQLDLLKQAVGRRWVENDLVFPNSLGKPMSSKHMQMAFKRLLRENDLPDIRFHDLRHTSITFLLDRGTPVNTVQQRAGHSKASLTTDTYGHSTTHAEHEAADRIEELITPVAVKLQSS